MAKQKQISLKNISKKFGEKEVLKKVNLDIGKNEVVAIIGPSGAGKTTLLRLMAGVEPADEGTMLVCGKVGMVLQDYHLWPHKTVKENIVMPLVKVGKFSAFEANQKADEILAKFGLSHVANSFPETLSGGEMQRSAIARTLAMEPEILLMDEITSSLDPQLVNDIISVIRKLSRDNRTLILVTHQMDFAKEVSDKVIFFKDGGIIEEGHPYKIFDNPSNLQTKQFVQSIAR